METILEYFPDLTDVQKDQFKQLGELYKDWNTKINVISRKDIENVYQHHILHSMVYQKIMPFAPGSKVLDLGTGGGLPGIPLAILNPEVDFLLIDGTLKKIKVVKDIIEQLNLTNANARQIRAEELKKVKFDFVVSRAVARLSKLVPWSRPLLKEEHINIFPNGMLFLKGGKIKEEVKELGHHEFCDIFDLADYVDLPYYEEKSLVYVQG